MKRANLRRASEVNHLRRGSDMREPGPSAAGGGEALSPWLDLTAACGVRSGRFRDRADSDWWPLALERSGREGMMGVKESG